MTVIVAVKDKRNKCVVMASDGAANMDGTTIPEQNSKIIRMNNGVLFGSSGDRLVSAMIDYGDPPTVFSGELCRWAFNTLGPWLWERVKDRGRFEVTDNRPAMPAYALLAYREQIVLMAGDCSVTEIGSPYWAIGSGGGEARGALAALWEEDADIVKNAERYARRAVEIACEINDGCALPVRFAFTEP